MKNEKTIYDFKHMIDKINHEMHTKNLSEDLDGLPWRIDLFSHFQELGLIQPYRKEYYIDLWPYYKEYIGWSYDHVGNVIDLLGKVRFFNRFDADTLTALLKKVTFKRIKEREILFMEEDEAAIIVSG